MTARERIRWQLAVKASNSSKRAFEQLTEPRSENEQQDH